MLIQLTRLTSVQSNPPESEKTDILWVTSFRACSLFCGMGSERSNGSLCSKCSCEVDRCIMESNFPIDKISCSYTVCFNALKKCVRSLSKEEKHKLFELNARRAYGL